MAQLGESNNFVPLSELTTFSEQTTFRQVTQQLDQAQLAGGFIVESEQHPLKYVQTSDLAKQALALTQNDATLSIGQMSLAELLRKAGLEAPAVSIIARSYPLESDVNQVDSDHAGTVVTVTQNAQDVGVFFTKDEMRSSLDSPPPKYLCPIGHVSNTFDDGTCSQCARPLERTK